MEKIYRFVADACEEYDGDNFDHIDYFLSTLQDIGICLVMQRTLLRIGRINWSNMFKRGRIRYICGS